MLTNSNCSFCGMRVPIGHNHYCPPSIPIYRTDTSTGIGKASPGSTDTKSEGKRYDAGKPRVSLLMGYAIEQVMLVGEFGAKKYGDDNYRAGMAVSKYLNAAFRHAFIEFLFKGIDNDAESGLPHLAHAAWNLLAACEQMLLKPEFDDRYTTKQKSEGSK